MDNRIIKTSKCRTPMIVAGSLVIALGLSACTTSEVLNQGYVVDQQALDLTPVGSSREQVLISLGTPSTTATLDGEEVFYYISQRRARAAAFMRPRLVAQSILAVYFDDAATVRQIANYTLKDGKVFDLISRTTPTGGRDQTFLGQVLSGATSPGSAQGTVRDILGN